VVSETFNDVMCALSSPWSPLSRHVLNMRFPRLCVQSDANAVRNGMDCLAHSHLMPTTVAVVEIDPSSGPVEKDW